jgi:hypothetical protein
MYHPDDLDQAIHARQARFRHQAYVDRLAHRSLRTLLGRRLIQLGTALSGSQVTRTHS